MPAQLGYLDKGDGLAHLYRVAHIDRHVDDVARDVGDDRVAFTRLREDALGRQAPLDASKQAPGDEAQQRNPQPGHDHPFMGSRDTQQTV